MQSRPAVDPSSSQSTTCRSAAGTVTPVVTTVGQQLALYHLSLHLWVSSWHCTACRYTCGSADRTIHTNTSVRCVQGIYTVVLLCCSSVSCVQGINTVVLLCCSSVSCVQGINTAVLLCCSSVSCVQGINTVALLCCSSVRCVQGINTVVLLYCSSVSCVQGINIVVLLCCSSVRCVQGINTVVLLCCSSVRCAVSQGRPVAPRGPQTAWVWSAPTSSSTSAA